MNLGLPELGIVLLVVLVLFGGSKIPKLARSLGQAQKEFKAGLDDEAKDEPSQPDATKQPDSTTKPDA